MLGNNERNPKRTGCHVEYWPAKLTVLQPLLILLPVQHCADWLELLGVLLQRLQVMAKLLVNISLTVTHIYGIAIRATTLRLCAATLRQSSQAHCERP